MPDVVLRLDDEDAKALRCEEGGPGFSLEVRDRKRAILAKLRAALDSVEVNETDEYRVLGEDGHAVRGFRELESAENEKRRIEGLGMGSHRIQRRRVLLGLTPWTDLPGEGEQ